MKKYIYLFILINFCYVHTTLSQVVFEESFENVTCGENNPFFEDCIQGWISTHGSPSIRSNNIPIGPYEGDKYAFMYTEFNGLHCSEEPNDPHLGEGIALNHNFQQATTYELTYAIRQINTTITPNSTYEIEIDWILTNELPNNTGVNNVCDPGSVLPSIPPNSKFLPLPYASYNSNNWNFQKRIFTVNTGEDFSQLWLRVRPHSPMNDAIVYQEILLDAVKLEIIPCEPKDVTITANNEDITSSKTYTIPCGENSVTLQVTNLVKPLKYITSNPNVFQDSPGVFYITDPTVNSFAVSIHGTDSCGNSYDQKVLISVEQDCCEVISPPSNLEYKGSTLSWDPVLGAVSYIVESPNLPFSFCNCKYPSSIGKIETSDTSVNLPLTGKDTCYMVQVSAVCSDGNISEPSNPICVGEKAVIIKGGLGLQKVFVTPNPSKGAMTFNVLTSDTSEVSIEVHNIYGKLVKSFVLNASPEKMSSVSWDESNLKKGIYFVTFTSNTETRYSKVIVE